MTAAEGPARVLWLLFRGCPAHRRLKIAAAFAANPNVSRAALAREFGVNPVTIYYDFVALAQLEPGCCPGCRS